MADLNALIAQGAQFDLPNPVDQYSKVMQLQAAQQQMQVNRQQMQQIQEDRAGFAKLRETLAQQNLTPEQYEAALTQSPDPSHQKMGVEMRFRRSRLAELEKAMGGAEPVSAPSAMLAPTEMPAAKTFDTSAAMVAPVQKPYSEMSNREKILYNEWTGRGRQLQPSTAVYTVDGQVAPFNDYVNANIANNAGAGERAAIDAMPNALAAQVAPAAPVANAMVAQAPVANATSTKQAQLADISKKLAVLTKPQFSDVAGVKDQIAYLRDEQKRLSESPLAKIDPKDYDPDSFAAYMQTGDATKLRKITDQRLAFDKAKFEWEKANPGKTIKEVAQGGVTKYFSVDDRSGVATPVTIASGKILTGTDMASQRLAFDQAKFAWEKANPGFTIQQTEDGSIVGVNNRTLNAYPVTLNAGTPPSPAPFTGIGGAAPSAGAGRGAVGVTDNRVMPGAPAAALAAAPAGMPLKGKSAGLTEAQSNAAMFGSSMAQAQNVLDEVEKKGTNTGSVTTSLAQGIVKYVPLGIGDKLVQDVYSVATQDPTKLFGPDVNQQRLGQAQLAFSIAYLRKTSGANFGASELVNTLNEFFPSIGEDSSVTKQKSESRKRAIAGMKISAGKEGAKFIEDYQKPNSGIGNTPSASDPLGIRK